MFSVKLKHMDGSVESVDVLSKFEYEMAHLWADRGVCTLHQALSTFQRNDRFSLELYSRRHAAGKWTLRS